MKTSFLSEKRVLSIPPLVYLICLFLIPTIFMIIIAFRVPGSYGGVAPIVEKINNHTQINFSLDSFKFTIDNQFIWQLFLRSLFFSALTTLICLLIGYPLALLIARSPRKYRDILLLLVIIPFWSSFLIRVYAWMIILGPQSGVSYAINFVLGTLGFAPINLLYSSFAVVACLVYINLPFMVLPLYANLEKHDIALIEASRDLGATKSESFWQITMPLSLPGILAGSGLVFIPCIGMFVVPELVGNNCSLMIGNLIKQQFLQTMNWPLGSVTSIIMTLLVLSVSLAVGLMFRRLGGLKYASK
ncbi:MAG: transporter permease [Burkholderiales bacterium]|jgi:spermidine/putrescine transport system permease protein|nr:transporter permease [Burkholderiales bacterium]